MKVAIIGAGIGGLCAAAGLHRAGVEVTIFERSAEVRAGGSGLSVFGNGARALDAVGVGDAFRAIGSPESATYRGGQRRPDGSWLSTYPMDAVSDLRIVDRAPLHALLRAAVPRAALRTECHVTDAATDGRVTWTDGGGASHTDRFDVVVAADGIRSTIRRSWTHDPGIAYSGYSTWRGITAAPVDLHGEAGETWGVGRRFGVAPLADGRVYWFAVLSIPRDHRFDDDHAALFEQFGGWHDPIPELIAATPPARIQYLPIDELGGRMRSYVGGRVVLLGDAAHAMTPNLGQGGGQAMEDAATLAALLGAVAGSTAPADAEVVAALQRYDALRVARTQKVAQRSRMVGRLAHVPGRALSGARDLVLRLTPDAALRKQLAWLQNWSPPG